MGSCLSSNRNNNKVGPTGFVADGPNSTPGSRKLGIYKYKSSD
jgi:hypothetical protein